MLLFDSDNLRSRLNNYDRYNKPPFKKRFSPYNSTVRPSNDKPHDPDESFVTNFIGGDKMFLDHF